MSSPTPHLAQARTAGRRPSLQATMLRIAAVAAVAAVLVWSVLFLQLVRERSSAATALPQAANAQTTDPSRRPAQAPAPVTTRTS